MRTLPKLPLGRALSYHKQETGCIYVNNAGPWNVITDLAITVPRDQLSLVLVVVSSGGAPTPAGTSLFTKHNWDMGMGYLWLNGWGIYHLMGGAFMA